MSEGDEVAVSLPMVQAESSAEGAQVYFKGSRKPCTKECILIINAKTGEATLEKISDAVQLKVVRCVCHSAVYQLCVLRVVPSYYLEFAIEMGPNEPGPLSCFVITPFPPFLPSNSKSRPPRRRGRQPHRRPIKLLRPHPPHSLPSDRPQLF